MLFKTLSMVALAAALTACSNTPDDRNAPTNSPGAPGTTRVKGMAVTQGNTTYIFITDRKDKLLALQESLAGIDNGEIWYRFEFPTKMIPPPSVKATIDLASNPEVGIVIRDATMAKAVTPPQPVIYTLRVGPSNQAANKDLNEVSGKLELTGFDTELQPTDEFYKTLGLAMQLHYSAYVMVDGKKAHTGGTLELGHAIGTYSGVL